MKKNLRSCMEQQDFGEPECLLDMNDYGLITAGGLTPDLRHKKSAHMSAAWSFAAATEVRIPLPVSDLSGYRWLTFSVFAAAGQGGSFRLRFEISINYCHEKAEIPAEQTVRDFPYGNSGIRSSFLISFDKICCFYSKRQQAGG